MTNTFVDKNKNSIMLGDCLEIMRDIEDKSIDLVLTDPPYGTTSNKWDITVDFWHEFKRICKTGFILFSSQPFTTDLINSNRKDFKYCWVWDKGMTGNFAIARHQPLKTHEDICIFGDIKYIPIMRKGKPRYKGGSNKGNTNTGGIKSEKHYSEDYYPVSILDYNNAGNRSRSQHPTQKPVSLFKYLIQTYSEEGMTILDPFAGSGTTAIACHDLKRNFICIEKEPEYHAIATKRYNEAKAQMTLF